MIRNAKVDSNQSEIVKALRNAGAWVTITSQLKNAFDILAGYKGKLFIVEIKDGMKPPSARRLSEGEQKCKDGFNSVGVYYYIITSIDEALHMICEHDYKITCSGFMHKCEKCGHTWGDC